jgi:hypothetical protein
MKRIRTGTSAVLADDAQGLGEDIVQHGVRLPTAEIGMTVAHGYLYLKHDTLENILKVVGPSLLSRVSSSKSSHLGALP